MNSSTDVQVFVVCKPLVHGEKKEFSPEIYMQVLCLYNLTMLLSVLYICLDSKKKGQKPSIYVVQRNVFSSPELNKLF